ncbi:hypothetical protein [Streptomyces sp. RB17]|uniref:hypothetical protein n=1 Tax=Streptomyces sp. RB17 TaxID=2585197 RepID=UPI00225DEB61|nr:hypothetical protein [Streptomyces sp. RB17]
MPGSFKNLLDRTVGGTEICDQPTAWINGAAPGRGRGTEATLPEATGEAGARGGNSLDNSYAGGQR